MTITIQFLAAGMAVFSFQVLFRGLLNLWDAEYDDVTDHCSRSEHFFPRYQHAQDWLGELWDSRAGK